MISTRHFALTATAAILFATAAGVSAQSQVTGAGLGNAAVGKPSVPATLALSRPAWLDDDVDPSHIARVASVQPGVADVVVLDGGLYENLRIGTPCLVLHNGTLVGEMVVVASNKEHAAALIIPRQIKGAVVAAGDDVSLKFRPAR
jgi:hypothetical protein